MSGGTTDQRRTLVLFSASYPYAQATESTFIGPELPHLCAEFDRVVLVPMRGGGEREGIPPGVEVEDGCAALEPNRLTARTALKAIANGMLYAELRSRPATLLQPAALAALLRCAGGAERIRGWLPELLRCRDIDPPSTVFYTYWMGAATLAAVELVRTEGGRVVSRAHGFDLYRERRDPPYIPCQAAILRGLDALFLACRHARDYVLEGFPLDAPRCEVSFLGVPEPGAAVPNLGSTDGVLRIASCSNLVPVKRVDLLVRSIARAAQSRPDLLIEWSHLGGGPEGQRLAALAAEILPPNASVEWHGALPNREVRAFYASRPVDVFATTTSSEGGVPVSIMEAQSHGIPVIAPLVGGITDILSRENGIPLAENATEIEIAEALLFFSGSGSERLAMRDASRRVCVQRFDADRNSRAFAARLGVLASESSVRKRAVGGVAT